jgi:hypothetical protein
MGLDQPISPVQLIVSPKAAETWAGAK